MKAVCYIRCSGNFRPVGEWNRHLQEPLRDPPTNDSTRPYQLEIVRYFSGVFILIDGLEKVENTDVSGTINQLRRSCQSVHLLVTSRDNAGLDESLNAMPTEIVDMRNEEGFRRDIVEWVNSRLYNHHTISRYPDKHDEIRSALIERAQYWWGFSKTFFAKY